MSQLQASDNISDWAYLKRLLSYLKGEGSLLSLTILCLVGYGFAQAYAPTLIAKAVDENITQKDYAGLSWTMMLLFGIYILLLFSFRYQFILLGQIGQRVLVKLRSDIFEKMQKLPLQFYHDNEPGDLMSRLINDSSNVGTLFSQSIAQTVGSVVGLLAIVIAMFLLDWRMALSTFSVIPIMIWLTFYFSKRSRIAFQKSTKSMGTLSSNIEEDLRLVRESQSFAREALTMEQFEQNNSYNRDANIEAIRITAAFAPSIDVLSTVAQVIVIVFGAYLVFIDLTTVGIVVAFLAYAQRFYRPIQMLSSFYTQLQSTLASAERIFDVIDAEAENQGAGLAVDPSEVKGKVTFDNVYFSYDDRAHVLNGISFEAKPGQSIAFIGETGVGKSTCLNLIPRFYDVDKGAIKIDGKNIKDFSLEKLRSLIAEVPQSSYLFTDTIANNISFGDPNPDMEKVKQAAQMAQALGFIEALPNQFEEQIGADGIHLSQGQQQLICIARALYSDPRILLLDEATSNIDSQTEAKVQHAIDRVLKGRTSFVIAHRLSTIRNVDKIIVLGKEGILEQGSHEELIHKAGYYKRMMDAS